MNTKDLLAKKIHIHANIYKQCHGLQAPFRTSDYLGEFNVFVQLGPDWHRLGGGSRIWRSGKGLIGRDIPGTRVPVLNLSTQYYSFFWSRARLFLVLVIL